MQDSPSSAIISAIRADIVSIKENGSLYDDINFNSRADAMVSSDGFFLLKQEAEQTKHRLEEINSGLFERLRATIRAGGCKGDVFKATIRQYFGDDLSVGPRQTQRGYDNLDIFINELLLQEPVPDETFDLLPEMVFYQQTPARIIFELVEKANLQAGDVFYDLGSGLGHVPILVNLMSGAKTKGVEFEPAYCAYATACANKLNLPRVQFINQDARSADYSDGTVFFMYTPFEGRMLNEVLEMLRVESHHRQITLFTYGPCTIEVARQRWLHCEYSGDNNIYSLGMFGGCTELRRQVQNIGRK